MQSRYRIPTIFSIYMLDVICCALGCVVLLWQAAHQEAEEQTAAAKEQSSAAVLAQSAFVKSHADFLAAAKETTHLQDQLAGLKRKVANVSEALERSQKERDEARSLAETRLTEIDKNRKALSLSEDQLKKLEDDLAKLYASNKKTNAELTGTIKLNVELLAKIVFAEKQITTLKSEIAGKQTEIASATKKYEQQLAVLNVSEEAARKLQKLLDVAKDDGKDAQTKLKLTVLQLKVREQDLERATKDLKDLLAAKEKITKELSSGGKELLDARNKLAALGAERDRSKEQVVAGAKELTSANAALGALKAEKNKLNKRVVDLEAEVEQRFAGIPLTGESVIFLIDVSGSMVMKDAKTEDPDKWPFLCDTLMRLMRSIGTMKRFQIIVFSDKASYLFATRDAWLRYEGPKTAKLAHDALRKFEVGGNTNMQEAFEEAFRYRPAGLDTIYLFSDGLPNVGDGLPTTITNPNEAQLNFHLGKYVRDKLKNDWNRPIAGKEAVRINSIGFYFESPDVGAFLWALSREHRGNFVGVR